MNQYSKVIAAAVGLLLIYLKDVLGIEVPSETGDNIVNGILSLATVYSVFQLSNSKPTAVK